MLHDLGKVLIPSKILNKPSKLNKKERIIVGLGSEISESKYGYESIFTFSCDQG